MGHSMDATSRGEGNSRATAERREWVEAEVEIKKSISDRLLLSIPSETDARGLKIWGKEDEIRLLGNKT